MSMGINVPSHEPSGHDSILGQSTMIQSFRISRISVLCWFRAAFILSGERSDRMYRVALRTLDSQHWDMHIS